MRLTENLEDFGDFAVAFDDELVGVEELVAVETRQVRTNVGLTCRHGANEHDGSGAFREVLVHFTHLLRVDASTGGLVFCERVCGGGKLCGGGELCGCHRFSRGCGQLGSVEGLLPCLALFFRGGCNGCCGYCGRGNLNLAEQRRGRTDRLGGFSRGHSYRMCRCRLGCGRRGRSRRRLGFSLLHGSRSALPRRLCRLSLLRRCRLGCGRLRHSRLGCFRLRGFLAGFLFSGAHSLQGAEQLQAQVLVQAERRVGVLRYRGGVQAHTLRARRSGGGQGAGARTHQVSGGGHARSRARRRNRCGSLTRNSLTNPSARSLNSLSARNLNTPLSRSRYTGFGCTGFCAGFRARRSAPSRTLRCRSNTRKGARSDRANTLLHRNLPGTATLSAAALRLRRKGHYASQPATLDSHARDAGIASR